MSTVYLNIGTPKTGTTAVQSFLRENESLLEQKGYCFPDLTPVTGKRRYQDRNGHFLIHNAGNPQKQDGDLVREKGFRMLGELAQKYPNIILSDEELWKTGGRMKGFWPYMAEEFRKIGCEVKIIVYLRRQDLFIQSLWNQNVKSRYMRRTESFEECMEKNLFSYFPLNYYEHLLKVNECIKKEDIIVRPFEECQFQGEEHSIYSDFLKCTGLDLTEEFTRETVRSNPGLRGNFIELKRIINSVPEYREMDDFMVPSLRQANECIAYDGLHADHSMFSSYQQQMEFLGRYEETNRKTAEVFLDRPDGRLFYEPVEELPVWGPDPDTMYRDILLVMTEILCRQEQQLREMKRNLKKIRGSFVFRSVEKVGSFLERV